MPVGEIVSEGNIGLMKAVKKFEPEKGFRLATYAMWWIKASIQEYNIPVIADLGSGTFIPMDKYGIPAEIPIKDIVRKGPEIILFSGDKMLGGPQSGIILSSKKIIEKIKSNSIYRTVR